MPINAEFNHLDVGKALKLKQKGYSGTDIAKIQGVHPSTVSKALKSILPTEDTKLFVEQEPQIYDELKRKIVISMTNKVNDKRTTFGNLAFGLDKVFGAGQTLRGLPSSINFTVMAQFVEQLRQDREKS